VDLRKLGNAEDLKRDGRNSFRVAATRAEDVKQKKDCGVEKKRFKGEDA